MQLQTLMFNVSERIKEHNESCYEFKKWLFTHIIV